MLNNIPKISEAELEVMKIVWSYYPVSTNDVTDKLIKTTTWSPKTIQTLLARLVKKGVLTYKKDCRTFVYEPTVLESEYVLKESHAFLKRFYGGMFNSMAISFINQEELTKEEIEELKKILDEGDVPI